MLHAALMTPTDVVIQLVAACEVFRAVFASIDEGSAEVNVFDMLPHIATIRANPSAYCTSVTRILYICDPGNTPKMIPPTAPD